MRIPGYNRVRSGGDSAFQDAIIRGIVPNGIYSLSRLDEVGQVLDLINQGADNPLRILKLFSTQDSLDFIEDGPRDGPLDPAFDGEFQNLARLPTEEDSRDKDVGIENKLRLGGRFFWHGTS